MPPSPSPTHAFRSGHPIAAQQPLQGSCPPVQEARLAKSKELSSKQSRGPGQPDWLHVRTAKGGGGKRHFRGLSVPRAAIFEKLSKKFLPATLNLLQSSGLLVDPWRVARLSHVRASEGEAGVKGRAKYLAGKPPQGVTGEKGKGEFTCHLKLMIRLIVIINSTPNSPSHMHLLLRASQEDCGIPTGPLHPR